MCRTVRRALWTSHYPAIEYQRIDNLAILPDMAIASKKQVRSLLIISKKPIEQVNSFASMPVRAARRPDAHSVRGKVEDRAGVL